MSQVTTGTRIATWTAAIGVLVIGILATAVRLALGGTDYIVNADTGLLAFVVAAPVLGLILVLRAGAVRMGALLLAMGLGNSLAFLGAAIPPSPENLGWLPLVPFANAGWMVFLALTIAGLPLLFPTGRPLTRRWQPVLLSLLVLVPLVAVLNVFSEEITLFCSDVYPEDTPCSVWEQSEDPIAVDQCEVARGPLGEGTECVVALDNPIGIPGVSNPESGLVGMILYSALLTMSILAIVSMGLRFRRGAPQERQQIKFVFFVLGVLVFSTLLDVVVVEVFGGFLPVMEVIDFLMWVAIPLSIFLAITRYRLYDIDRLISRTLAYAIVAGLLAGAVALVATVIGTRFSDPLVVAGTTLAVAAIFNPLRRRIQVWVDRRFNRSKYDVERVMDEFAGTLRDEAHNEEVVDGWKRVVSDTMQPSSLGVWIRN